MHPSSALLVWLTVIVGVQYAGYAALLVLAAALMCAGGVLGSRWISFVSRSRWLLLTLWLILAGNVPGEAVFELPWAPTYEGMAEANLHALRLVLMLGCLAWLFTRLDREELVSGLWGLLLPVRRLGLDTERLVVRLSLVLGHLETRPEKGAWREMLLERDEVAGPEVMHLALPHWQARDSAMVVLAILCVAGVIVL